jgi:ergothioneine biosynthesis protein EgtB
VPLAQRFAQVRAYTLALTQGLTAEDMQVQSMADASPIKWHLAHTTWFFETFLLQRFLRGYLALNPAYRTLFNSYYVSVGERHPRPQRGLVTRPGIDEVLAYRAHVSAAMLQLFEKLPADAVALVELGLQHEQQHQELMLTDVKHLFSCNPLLPAVRSAAPRVADEAAAQRFTQFKGGLTPIGHIGDGFCFDNETPRHPVFLQPFALANRLTTNREYLAFVEDGGYTQAHCWLSEGVDWINREAATQPFYWRKIDGKWHEFTLTGLQPLELHRPVSHICYFEADAYARWADARLPTEFEWEHAALQAGSELAQLFGACWQWTSSSYAPYPGYAPLPGAVGEYNGKFMVNQYVLRGSSVATPPGHARASYRNFFPAAARWQFSGLRLARSL